MKRLWGWAFYGALLAVAAAAAIAASHSEQSRSSTPSVDNPGTAGLRALYLYLEETGATPLAWREPLTAWSATNGTLVLPAPTARPVSQEEVRALERFVRGGGTLVYLAPRAPAAQPELSRWLKLRPGEALAPTPSQRDLHDLGGATAEVWVPYGPLRDARTLRVGALGTVEAGGDALPVAGVGDRVVAWWRGLGAGQIWVLAGPDLAENRRLDLADNLAFWGALERPIRFDEHHHVAAAARPTSPALAGTGLQLLACFLLFVWSAGARLGPARVAPEERHRSTLEYLDSLGTLARRARVEKELLLEHLHRLRVLMQERAGIPVTLGHADAARELGLRCEVEPDRYLRLVTTVEAASGKARVSPKEYARLSLELARLERVLTGRAA